MLACCGQQVASGRQTLDGFVRLLETKNAGAGFRRVRRRIKQERSVQPAQPLAQRKMRVSRQIVDAAVLHQIHQQRIRRAGIGITVLRQMRAVAQLQARATAQRAHRTTAGEQQCTRLQAFHDLLGNALCVGGIGRQRWADRQIRVRAARYGTSARRRMATHAVLAFRVPSRHGHATDRGTAVAGDLLDGVAFFLAVCAVVTNTAVGSGFRIFSQLRAVGKDHQRVATVGLVVFHRGETEPRLGQQARDEVVVGLTKLRDMAARAEVAHARLGAGGIAPRRIRRVRVQHLFEDVSQRPVLKYLAVALLRRQPEPGHHGQPVAREAAVCTQLFCQADQPSALGLGAVGQGRDQRHTLAEQGLERDACVGADRHHAPLEQLGERLAAEPRFHR